MTPAELKTYIATQLAVPVNQVQKLIDALYAMVDFSATQNTDSIPDWTALLTFNTDGSGDGKYCKHPDTNGKKRIFETSTDGNINNEPPTDPLVSSNANWDEISASAGSAIQEWAAGVYGTGLIIVYHNHSTDGRGLYILLEPTRPFTSADIEAEIVALKWERLGGAGNGLAIAGTYATIAALLADQANQDEDAWYLVQDASTDTTVNSGWAIYQYLGTTVGDLTDYLKIAEQESLDVTINNASETAKGIVEEATDAETAAGTAAGATGARLFVNPAKLITWWTAIKAAAQTIAGLWTFTKAKITHAAFGTGTLTDAANIAWDADVRGNIVQVTLGGNRTLDPITNPQTGGIYIIRVIQDATGSRTLTFNAAYTFPDGVTPVLNSAANAVTTFSFFYDGTAFRLIANGGGRVKFSDVLIANQAASSGAFRLVYIDDTGKIVRETNFTVDPTNKRVILKALNQLSSGWTLEIQDSNNEVIAKFYNNKVTEFGGSACILEVPTGTTSGNAYLKILNYTSGNGIGYRVIDEALAEYMLYRTLTGDKAIIMRQPVEYDFGIGFKRVIKQYSIVTTNTNSGQNTIFEFTLADGEHYDIKVLHAEATATDGVSISSLGLDCADARKVAATNIEGNTSVATQSRLPASVTDGGFNWNLDTTNQKIQYRFQNTSSGARVFTIDVEVSYLKRLTPA